jgi:hypothetical protein
MKNIIKLTVGDWSKDGHNQSNSYTILTNFDAKQMNAAYKIATKSLGFDYVKDVCSQYEENVPSLRRQEELLKIPEVRQMMIKDWEIKESDLEKNDHGMLYGFCDFCDKSYVDIYLALIKHGDHSFEYKLQEFEEIKIGGYGLYY